MVEWLKDNLLATALLSCISFAFGYMSGAHHRKALKDDEDKYTKYKSQLSLHLDGYENPSERDIKIYLLYFKSRTSRYEKSNQYYLNVFQEGKNHTPHGYIDYAGIYFYEWPQYWGDDIYINTQGVFFYAPKGGQYPNFNNITDCRVLYRLPFENIERSDFEDGIDYKPLFFVNKKRNLFSTQIDVYPLVRNNCKAFFHYPLDTKHQIKGYNFFSVLETNLRIKIRKILGLS